MPPGNHTLAPPGLTAGCKVVNLAPNVAIHTHAHYNYDNYANLITLIMLHNNIIIIIYTVQLACNVYAHALLLIIRLLMPIFIPKSTSYLDLDNYTVNFVIFHMHTSIMYLYMYMYMYHTCTCMHVHVLACRLREPKFNIHLTWLWSSSCF